jgi:hypothetical protein
MSSSELLAAFERTAAGDPDAPRVDDLLADLQTATERGVDAVETIHEHAITDAATLDATEDADADAYVDVVETVEDVGYLAERVHAQTDLVADLVAAASDGEPDRELAQRVLDFAGEIDGDHLPSELAERYRDVALDDD